MSATGSPWYASGLRFACQACGRCCRNQDDRDTVFVGADDQVAIAGWLELPLRRFRARFTHRTKAGDRTLASRGDACIFLDERGCRIYPVRPVQCRTWPFWPENIVDGAAWQTAAADCPGIGQGRLHAAPVIGMAAAALDRADEGEAVPVTDIPDLATPVDLPATLEETQWGK